MVSPGANSQEQESPFIKYREFLLAGHSSSERQFQGLLLDAYGEESYGFHLGWIAGYDRRRQEMLLEIIASLCAHGAKAPGFQELCQKIIDQRRREA